MCDPIWHASSRSGEACCELLYPVTLFYMSGSGTAVRVSAFVKIVCSSAQ